MTKTKNKSSSDTGVKKDSLDSNILAAISYLSVISVVMYIVKKDDSFVSFHAKQGVVIFAFSLISIIPIVGWLISPFVLIVSAILMLVGALKAYRGEKFRIPVVAELADKVKF